MNAKRIAPSTRGPRPAKPLDPEQTPPQGDLPEQEVNLAATGESSAPKMPHERDETRGMTDDAPDKQIQKGAADMARGVQDTTRGAESDRAYKAQKR